MPPFLLYGCLDPSQRSAVQAEAVTPGTAVGPPTEGTGTPTIDTPDDSDIPFELLDTDMPSDTAAPGDTGEPAGVPLTPPEVTSVVIVDDATAEEHIVVVGLGDADADVEGGTLTLAVDGVPTDFDIPDALEAWTWSGTSGSATARLGYEPCDALGATLSFEATAEDASGLLSATPGAMHVLPGFGERLVENGDTWLDAEELGTIATRTMLCGDIRATVAPEKDLDWARFTAPVGGQWSFYLHNDSGGSSWLQLQLNDDANFLVTKSAGGFNDQSFQWALTAGTVYRLFVVGDVGTPATDYRMRISGP